jgi:hypothetical protein
MAFEKKVPEWMAEGIEPPESLKTSGFEPGMKPPAAYFNWFMHGMSEAATELQERVDDSAPAPFIVTLSGNKDDGYTIDYTFDEIVGAYNQGRVIRLIEFVPGPAIMEYSLEVAVSDQVVFANSERMYHKTVNIYRNGRITRVDQTLFSDKYPPHYSVIGAEPVGAVSDHNEDENAHDGMFAPASHAANTTTYGTGTGTNYGHVKLSDSTNSNSGAGSGIAATPSAVKAAYDLASGKAPASHNHGAENISAGTFSDTGVKAKAGTDYSTARVRNIYAGTEDMTAGSSALENGALYFVYE